MNDEPHEWVRGDFVVSTDRRRLDLDVVHGYLASSYWASGMPRAVLEQGIENSLTFGVYRGDEQVGFARVITDLATYAYLSDVFVRGASRPRLVEVVDGVRSGPSRSAGAEAFRALYAGCSRTVRTLRLRAPTQPVDVPRTVDA